jgi:hypothetical protein
MGALDLPAPADGAADDESFAVVAEDSEASRWIIEPGTGQVRRGDGEVDSVITGTAEDLVLMITEEENLGALLRAGRIRHLTARDDLSGEDVRRSLYHAQRLLTADRSDQKRWRSEQTDGSAGATAGDNGSGQEAHQLD